MDHWISLAKVADCPPGHALEVVAQGRVVALYNVAGTFHALDGICPHQGGPLAKGQLQGCIVSCPWHGWQFDVTTGAHQLNPRLHQPRFPVQVKGDSVMVQLSEDSPELHRPE